MSIAELFSKNANTEIPSIYGALTGQARNFLNNQPALDWPDRQPITNYFGDHFTFFANSPLPNLADISICNKSDLIIAFDSSARAALMPANN